MKHLTEEWSYYYEISKREEEMDWRSWIEENWILVMMVEMKKGNNAVVVFVFSPDQSSHIDVSMNSSCEHNDQVYHKSNICNWICPIHNRLIDDLAYHKHYM